MNNNHHQPVFCQKIKNKQNREKNWLHRAKNTTQKIVNTKPAEQSKNEINVLIKSKADSQYSQTLLQFSGFFGTKDHTAPGIPEKLLEFLIFLPGAWKMPWKLSTFGKLLENYLLFGKLLKFLYLKKQNNE